MSGLTVRSYVKWAMDPSSFAKVQTQYHGHLSKLQKEGIASTQKTNDGLRAQHAKFVKELDGVNEKANERLARRSKRIAKEVEHRAKAAAVAEAGGRITSKGTFDKRYAMDAKAYDKALKSMNKSNMDYVTRARAMGGKAGTGDQFSAQAFIKNEVGMRTKLIAMQKEHVGTLKRGTAEYANQNTILRQMISTQTQVGVEERKRNFILKENGMLARMSHAMMEKGIIRNNAHYREQLQLLMAINGTLDRMKMHVGQGLVNAFMASAIAIMAFGFRLQSVVDTFKEFEKELMNAQSIFQTSHETLYGLSDQIVDFGTKYGITLQTASEGLYTLASAGLSAADAQMVLNNTLKLSMAVQGDHETIAKLTTQTIFGFGLEMSDSAELTDKFAHAINKSLIEYQDLASAVKFAMPFFITTGQNIDQLLGSLEILTNRALEAGIAGRGLRQALSEFAQHADDNTAAFAKLGIKVTDSQGNFLMLTEIAKNFQVQMGEMTNDTELLTTLLEDLNVRGATAFVHLVQNADEFQEAVDDLANSAGSATAMADIQQQSLANQIQVVKNALIAPFLLSDKMSVAQGDMNSFSIILHDLVKNFEAFFVETMPDGTRVLTEQGTVLRDIVIDAVIEFSGLLETVLDTFVNLTKNGSDFAGVLKALFLPVKGLAWGIGLLGENGLQAVLMWKAFTMLLPISNFHILAAQAATGMLTIAESNLTLAKIQQNAVRGQGFLMYTAEQSAEVSSIGRKIMLAQVTQAVARSQMLANFALFAGFMLINKSNPVMKAFGYIMLFVAGALTAYSVALTLAGETTKGLGVLSWVAIAAAGAVAVAGGMAMSKALKVPEASIPMSDLGRRMYDSGGPSGGGLGSRHQQVWVEPGETIVPKTQNMLGGGGGITLNIGGDIITDDADDFAERIAEVLPEALRRQNDIGGI